MSQTARQGLSRTDIDNLELEAQRGNPKAYWEYLAKQPGADNYAKLNLAKLQNSGAGKTLNAFEAQSAQDHGMPWGTKEQRMQDSELVKHDLAARKRCVLTGKPEEALNLPADKIAETQDASYRQRGLDGSSYAPYALLLAAGRLMNNDPARHPDAQEGVWKQILGERDMVAGRASGPKLNNYDPNNPFPAQAFDNNMRSAAGNNGVSNDWLNQYDMAHRQGFANVNSPLSPNHIYQPVGNLAGHHYQWMAGQPGNPKKGVAATEGHWQDTPYVQNPYTGKVVNMPGGGREVTDPNTIQSLNQEKKEREATQSQYELPEDEMRARGMMAQNNVDDERKGKRRDAEEEKKAEQARHDKEDRREADKSEPASPKTQAAMKEADQKGLPFESKEQLFNASQLDSFKDTRLQEQQKFNQTSNLSNTNRPDLDIAQQVISEGRNSSQNPELSIGNPALGARV